MAILKIPNRSVSWLMAEFVVVALGVAIALAADGYRENLQNKKIN